VPLLLTVIYFAFPEQLPRGPHGERDHCAETEGQMSTMAVMRMDEERRKSRRR
jgi:hypothetical protein